MNRPLRLLLSLSALVFCASASIARAADILWFASPGISDDEVLTEGTQVFGYYYSTNTTRPPTVNVNTVPFQLRTTIDVPPGLNFNGSYNNVEGEDLYQVPLSASNQGLSQILDGQNWGAEAPLQLTGLVPGGPYMLQFMVSDDRSGFRNLRNYDVSNDNDPEGSRDVERAYHSTAGGGVPLGAPLGSIEAKIFTGVFTADPSGTQDIRNWLYEGTDHGGGNSGSQINAIQLRSLAVPEPASITLALLGFGMYELHRRWSKSRRNKQPAS